MRAGGSTQEFRGPLRLRKASTAAASHAGLGVIRVDADFEDEYPDGSASATEVVATLCRVGDALRLEIDRAMQASTGVPEAVLNCLAAIEGSPVPLTPSQISERTFRPSATMTNILDALEHRGWAHRIPNPDDRRSVLVEITDAGKAVCDQFLPGIRTLDKAITAGLTEAERSTLMDLLTMVL
jgi:DNA-binding MarR family transcriptional regulator